MCTGQDLHTYPAVRQSGQVDHVADQVEQTRVHKIVRQPLDRVHAVTEDQGPLRVRAGGEHEVRQRNEVVRLIEVPGSAESIPEGSLLDFHL